MTTKVDAKGSPEPLQQAGPVRRTMHYLFALLGWVLFGYWWWIVLGHTGRHQIVWTLAFIGISLAVIVLVTALWVVHNVRIFRQKGPRLHQGARPVDPREGAPVLPPMRVREDADLLTSPVVRVVIEGGLKAYRTAGLPSRLARNPRGAAADAS